MSTTIILIDLDCYENIKNQRLANIENKLTVLENEKSKVKVEENLEIVERLFFFCIDDDLLIFIWHKVFRKFFWVFPLLQKDFLFTYLFIYLNRRITEKELAFISHSLIKRLIYLFVYLFEKQNNRKRKSQHSSAVFQCKCIPLKMLDQNPQPRTLFQSLMYMVRVSTWIFSHCFTRHESRQLYQQQRSQDLNCCSYGKLASHVATVPMVLMHWPNLSFFRKDANFIHESSLSVTCSFSFSLLLQPSHW